MIRIASEIVFIVLLVLANGVFAMAEIAIISCRKSRLRTLAEQGDGRAQVALDLVETPNRFLSTVQVGITVIGVLAGAFGGATIAGEIARALQQWPWLAAYSDAIGIGIVVICITLLSVVLGELVPKRLALNNPIGIALVLVRPLRRFSNLTSPVVSFLSALTDTVLKISGFRPRSEPGVTEDEVRSLIEQGHQAGVFFTAEKEIVEHALALDRKCVGDLMTRRAQIVWLCAAESQEVNWRRISDSGHSYFPVCEHLGDKVLGVVSVKALWVNLVSDRSVELRSLVTEPLFVSAHMTALKLLETFKHSRKHLALVRDDFGAVQGLVTLVDVFEAIVGDIPAFDEPPQRRVVLRDDGSWLVDGAVELRELKRLLGAAQLPREGDETGDTLGEFAMHTMQRTPVQGDHFEWGGFRFEVASVDGHRLNKILIRRLRRRGLGSVEPNAPGLPNRKPK